MGHISIELNDVQTEALRREATSLGLKPEDLARAVVSDLLNRSSADFEAAVARVLEKNAELYRRLSQ